VLSHSVFRGEGRTRPVSHGAFRSHTPT